MKRIYWSFAEIIKVFGKPYYENGVWVVEVEANIDYRVTTGVFRSASEVDAKKVKSGDFYNASKAGNRYLLQ